MTYHQLGFPGIIFKMPGRNAPKFNSMVFLNSQNRLDIGHALMIFFLFFTFDAVMMYPNYNRVGYIWWCFVDFIEFWSNF